MWTCRPKDGIRDRSHVHGQPRGGGGPARPGPPGRGHASAVQLAMSVVRAGGGETRLVTPDMVRKTPTMERRRLAAQPVDEAPGSLAPRGTTGGSARDGDRLPPGRQ